MINAILLVNCESNRACENDLMVLNAHHWSITLLNLLWVDFEALVVTSTPLPTEGRRPLRSPLLDDFPVLWPSFARLLRRFLEDLVLPLLQLLPSLLLAPSFASLAAAAASSLFFLRV